MPDLSETMRIFEPYPGLFAYYDGRIAGKRLWSDEENWLDDGAYSLGIATYALVDGADAIVYDTHTSLDHARAIRRHLKQLGVTTIRVVLSHGHTDHVAGNAVFADCEIIALQATADYLAANRLKLETGSPSIMPLVMPNRLFEKRLSLRIGNRAVELLHFDIHSADGCVLWLPDAGILLAGDTVEDTVTYVSEPEHTAIHIRELERLAALPITRILPDHGAPEIIAAGGYAPSLIAANRAYLTRLLERLDEPGIDELPLAYFVATEIESGAIGYFAPYDAVHRQNIACLRGVQPV
ncbi:MBL fold metallo-hydrolase [Rhizobium halophytocola]|uniref:Glyoxylase-like metal-dependent hydrolase (Beta-lactamase superfamily II) n=1 Tax=Rhizobium halophytocola TaxID=735519 RepID=A0ABS4DYE9_9HYPH|nr:MBL fold metallo-hydrolase [Rhizobium halophytocola]MBP1850705.1 glyoxylase-like metal-dependent hydrolase (beta-lactamase superfamily II) [Rhizobium halophytocola]